MLPWQRHRAKISFLFLQVPIKTQKSFFPAPAAGVELHASEDMRRIWFSLEKPTGRKQNQTGSIIYLVSARTECHSWQGNKSKCCSGEDRTVFYSRKDERRSGNKRNWFYMRFLELKLSWKSNSVHSNFYYFLKETQPIWLLSIKNQSLLTRHVRWKWVTFPDREPTAGLFLWA